MHQRVAPEGASAHTLGYVGKRLLDYAGVLGLILVGLVAVPVGVIAIWLDDGGPVFYPQQRMGQGLREFTIWKLRTMRDGKVTRPGRWLRKYWIDEIPQAFNILRGDMSLVGVRPYMTSEFWMWFVLDARYALRQNARPGLISLVSLWGKAHDVAQAHGVLFPLMVDLQYLYTQNRDHDLWLVWLTVRKACGMQIPQPKDFASRALQSPAVLVLHAAPQ